MEDILSRKIWSLTTGKLLDSCDVDRVSDETLRRELREPDDIRIELVLKGAQELYRRGGCDVSEIYSPPRVCAEAATQKFGGVLLRPGWSLDLTTTDPSTGMPWDLSDTRVQKKVKQLIRDTEPFCVVGSPPCTAFSPLQELSRKKRDPQIVAGEFKRARAHILFCLDVYDIQIRARRHFVHEHPRNSKAWMLPEMMQFLLRNEVDSVITNMCMFGMKSQDEKGIGLVQKATRIMSTSVEVLKRIQRTCSGDHRHVQLISGRAKAAQVYPREFCHRMCEGIAAQKKLDDLGMRSMSLMSLEQMNNVAMVAKGEGESPAEALHEMHCEEGLEAYDDLNGDILDPKKMMEARMEEIKYFKEMDVYEKVNIEEAWKETGAGPIAVRWVDVNKGDSKNPKYRSRLVAKEFKTSVNPDWYAATPPSECLRLMLSKLASGKKAGATLMYADVSRAYFYAKAERPVYVKLPDEDRGAGDEGKCGRLKMSMYGTRDAALNWSKEYGDTLREAGFVQGRSNPCLFHHAKQGVSIMVHGDDFVAVGPEEFRKTTRKALEDKYRLKVEVLGLGEGQVREVRILNKII